jgi:hypothetical protein
MKKFLVLGLVALSLAGGLVLMSCSACPGGGTVKSKGDCIFNASTLSSKDCDDKCVNKQLQAAIVKNPSTASSKKYSCNC